ncbi:MAG: nucleoid-associated protein [Chitinophagales bacterium]|nr:nucleoid-associated protein [Chitinophagales bacterium]
MTIVDFTEVELQQLITHHVGNKSKDERIILSSELTTIEKDTSEFLLKYFLAPVKPEEFFSFTHTVKLEQNDIYTLAKSIFSNPKLFISESQNIAKLLYEYSTHPKIKEGELNVAYFSNIVFENETVDAIGIFKSETDVAYLKMKNQKFKFNIHHDYGFELKGMDKGCVIFNSEQEDGYRVLLVDNTNRAVDTQYWVDDFLQVKQVCDDYHLTNQFLGITKNFVTHQFATEYEATKADQIDLLNRSVEYFKSNESFEKEDFEKKVFQNDDLIESFRKYDSNYRHENEIDLTETFDISIPAVKKQARVFKSVLKLDKNFHIYIHGASELIEQGVDEDGRKFYKIYYKEES